MDKLDANRDHASTSAPPHRLAGSSGFALGIPWPRLWHTTAAGAALLLVFVVALSAQGSLGVVIGLRPSGRAIADRPTWMDWCIRGQVRLDRRRIAFCARVEGIVIARRHGPNRGEIHVAVIGDFHLTIVRLPDGARTPGLGGRIFAIGPLVRARDGQQEVQAFHWGSV